MRQVSVWSVALFVMALVGMDLAATPACGGGEVFVSVRRSAGACGSKVLVQREALRFETGLAIVPFAVPVAVPVATVGGPSVFYGVSRYSPRLESAGYGGAAQGDVEQTDRADEVPREAKHEAVGVMVRRCGACHTGAASQGEMRLFEEEGRPVERLPRHRIVDAVERGAMPPGEERLSEAEREALRDWARLPRDLVW